MRRNPWHALLPPLMVACLTPIPAAVAAEVELREEIRHLKERVDQLEREKGGVFTLPEGLELGGLVEVEGFAGEDYAGEQSSDITLATVELGLHASVSNWVEGRLVFLYEEGETDFGVDAGTVTLGNPDASPLFLTAGKMYLPFGNFTTGLISDPLTLELAETNESALLVGFEKDGAYGSVYAFNGDTGDGGGDTVEHFGARAGYATGRLDVGLGYLSSLGDSEALQDGLATTDLQEYVGGANAYAVYESNGFTGVAEYVSATGAFETNELAFGGRGAEPSAYNLEAGYEVAVLGRPAEVAVAYQGSGEALALGLPETRYLAGVSVSLNHRAALSFEWAHDEDYPIGEGGTGEEADTFTVQLAVEF